MICLPRGNTRDLFPVLATVSRTHHVFYPGLLTQSKAVPRDRPRKDLSRRQPPKHCSHGDETSQIPLGGAKRSVLQKYGYMVERQPNLRHVLLLFFKEVSGI